MTNPRRPPDVPLEFVDEGARPHHLLRDHKTASDPVTLECIVRSELDDGTGTEEWKAWVERTAVRHNVV